MLPKLISSEYEDKMYLLASEMIHDKKNNIWTIVLEIGKELVVLNSNISKKIPSVAEIRNTKPEVYENNNKVYYTGGCLFSAGVILIVNEKIIMLQKDSDAPFDPNKWTSTAGRCDLMPKDSSLKEFYEELSAFYEEGAVFFNIPGAGQTEKEIYNQTILRKKGTFLPFKEVPCKIDEEHYNCRVNIQRGNNVFPGGSFWSYYDSANNTLELRMIARASIDEKMFKKIIFEDGEPYNRIANSFFIEQLDNLSLVPTMEKFKIRVAETKRKG